MINPPPSARSSDLRAALTILAVVLTVGGVIWLGVLSDEVPVLREAHGRWQATGYFLISLLAVAVPVGALLHSLRAGRAGRSVRQGWFNSGLALAYGALVALIAWHVGPEVPDTFGSGRGGGIKGSYVAWLVCVLPAFTVVALFGGLFPRTGPAASAEDPADAPRGRDGVSAPRRFYDVVLLTAGISWAFGVLPFLFVLLTYAV
ncbi:hypothetical protein [Catellatospora sp. NPDC049609]|uniref:hypothetical protein n=1 Tax=Catellatospora sp. NPDC049609 TaxID=3155505 RepID=UPI00343AFEFB